MHKVRHHRAEIRKDALLTTNFTLFFIIIIIITLSSRADALRVRVPARRVVAARGRPAILGCEFSPDFEQNPDFSSLLVTWQRQEDNRVVHSFYSKQDQLAEQNAAYFNRTALFVSELGKGNASVKIENVGVKDAGRYLCTVSTSQGTDKGEVQLDYGAFYTEPRLSINARPSDVLVQYETEGYPTPEVMWKGESGENLSGHVQTSVHLSEDMGLYYIKSSYTAPNTPLNFTFLLKNQLLHQYLESKVSYTGAQNGCFKEHIAIALISVLLVCSVVVSVWIYHHKKK